jgi:hypothetical protein
LNSDPFQPESQPPLLLRQLTQKTVISTEAAQLRRAAEKTRYHRCPLETAHSIVFAIAAIIFLHFLPKKRMSSPKTI